VDGTLSEFGQVIHEIEKAWLKLQTYEEQISFDITNTGDDKIILGIL